MEIAQLLELEKEAEALKYKMVIAELEEKIRSQPAIGNSDWACNAAGCSSIRILKERILYPFRSELEGEIVYYSDKQGVPWKFNKNKFITWLDDNFGRIEWKGGE